ncbi:hypothetical protein ES705_28411 [subsurface metagenome]
MARVDIKEPREQESHFGLYRTSAGGQQFIIVRRKVGEPTDYMHTKSRKLARQRDNLTLASQHYAHLTPSQKAITRHQIEEVEYQKSHGKTDTKLLMGRQLFISKEMHSLEITQKQLVLPYELCIMLVDENLSPLAGELWLRYLKDGEWLDVGKEELATGSWLFSRTPRAQEAYRVYGEAEGYFDPELPWHQFMTEDEIRAYHYHKLHLPVDHEGIYPNGDGDLIQLLSSGEPHWQMVLDEDTEWIEPCPEHIWGWWTGKFVYKNWYPMVEHADLFTFTQPLWAVQHIYKVTINYLAARDAYPKGRIRSILKTHGQLYYGDYTFPHPPSEWRAQDYPLNPYTKKEWTKDEVIALQAGTSIDVQGWPGNLMCDRIYGEIYYL